MRRILVAAFLAAFGMSLEACGGGGNGGGGAPATTPTYTLGGTVSGLGSGDSVVLGDNGTDSLSVSSNGSFTFNSPIAQDSTYAVTVKTQPTGQVCTVANGTGSGVTANVSNVSVSCSNDTYTVGGTLSGLGPNDHVVLSNNADDALTLTANGLFTFKTPVAYNSSYSVTVSTQPSGQFCSVSGGVGADVKANVLSVAVACSSVSPGGIWQGTDPISGLAVEGVITETGSLRFIRSDGAQYVGSVVTAGNSISGTFSGYLPTGYTFPDGSTHGIGTIAGTLTQRQLINATISFTTANGTISSGVGTFNFNPLYNSGSSLAAVAGSYVDPSTGAIINVSASGQISSQDSVTGCTLTGSATIINGNYDAYGETYSFSGCTGAYAYLNGTTATGLGILDATVSPVELIIGVSNPAADYILTETLPRTSTSGTAVSPGGIWQGTDPISGLDLEGIITETGLLRFLRADGAQYVGSVVTYGNSISGSFTGYTPSGTTFPDGSITGSGTIAGTVVERQSITASIQFTTSKGTTSSGIGAFTFNSIYDLGSSVNAISGSYLDPSTGATISISSAGAISSVNAADGCSIAGSVSIINAAYDAYAGTYSFTGCTGPLAYLNNTTATGLGVLNTSTSPTQLLIGVSNPSAGYILTETLAATASAGAYAYAIAESGISQFALSASGDLSPLATPTVVNPVSGEAFTNIAADPSSTHLYALDDTVTAGIPAVAVYGIGASGELGEIGITSVSYPAFGIAVAPNGSALYVSGAAADITQYSIGPSGIVGNGQVLAVPGASYMYALSIDPSGSYLYGADVGANAIFEFSIANGTFSPIPGQPITGLNYPLAIAIHPSGLYVYVANTGLTGGGSGITQYTIGSNGALTTMTPAEVASADPSAIVVHPSGKYAYALNYGANTISQFNIGPTGGLTPMSTPTVSTSTQSLPSGAGTGLQIDPTGTYLYAQGGETTPVTQYMISNSGALVPLVIPTAPNSTNAGAIVIVP
jgi:6-phosphogluconolactonase (cycloisomerase 2 family)